MYSFNYCRSYNLTERARDDVDSNIHTKIAASEMEWNRQNSIETVLEENTILLNECWAEKRFTFGMRLESGRKNMVTNWRSILVVTFKSWEMVGYRRLRKIIRCLQHHSFYILLLFCQFSQLEYISFQFCRFFSSAIALLSYRLKTSFCCICMYLLRLSFSYQKLWNVSYILCPVSPTLKLPATNIISPPYLTGAFHRKLWKK